MCVFTSNFRYTLRNLGLDFVDNALCVYTNKHLIMFFKVDGIVILGQPSNLYGNGQFKKELLKIFKLRRQNL